MIPFIAVHINMLRRLITIVPSTLLPCQVIVYIYFDENILFAEWVVRENSADVKVACYSDLSANDGALANDGAFALQMRI